MPSTPRPGLAAPTPHLTERDFLDWAERQHGRHELIEGTAVMQAGASRDHERVAKRAFAALLSQVDEARFDVNKGDFGVRIRPARGRGSVLYPDVVVDRQDGRGAERATTTALVVIEVLSPSTDFAHHVAKLERYRALGSLVHYAVLDQRRPEAHLWTRGAAGWPAEPVRLGADGALLFPEIGAVVPLSALYRPVSRPSA